MIFKSSFPPVPISKETLHDKLLRAIWYHGITQPTRPCLVSSNIPEKVLTFHEVYTQAHSVRAFLRSLGFYSGDVACLVVTNCIEIPVFHLGVLASGGVVSGASTLFTKYELEWQFIDSRCKVIFTDDITLDNVMNAVSKCEEIKTVVCLQSGDSPQKYSHSNIVDWNDVISFTPDYDTAQVDPETIAVLPYSSGTTGTMKGVMLSHRNFGTMIDIFKDHLEKEVRVKTSGRNQSWYEETFLLNQPFFHIYGFTLINTCLLTGATAVVLSKFEPHPYLSAIERYKIRLLFVVPPILIFLAKDAIVDEYDISSVEYIFSGAAPAGKELCEEVLSRHKNVRYLGQGYGMTESTLTSHLPVLVGDDSYLGVGVVAATFQQKIIDISTGKKLDVGETGELCLRGPTVMMGYLNRPKETSETIDKEGWLHTGDVGYADQNGRTHIVDRLKELIKVKALQVAPAELEDVLLSNHLIKDAAVIGIPDEINGESVRAYVVRASDALSEDDVMHFVADKVAEYKRLTGGVKFIAEIPKSASGKILRRNLREQATKEVNFE